MMIIAITDFRDKTTAKKLDKMTLIKKGTLIQCDEKLAKERIILGLAMEVLNPEILVPKAEEEKPKAEEEKPKAEEEKPKADKE